MKQYNALVQVVDAGSTCDLIWQGELDTGDPDSEDQVADSLAAGADLHGRLQPEGRGEAEPVAPNDTPENRALNRRVEIDLLK